MDVELVLVLLERLAVEAGDAADLLADDPRGVVQRVGRRRGPPRRRSRGGGARRPTGSTRGCRSSSRTKTRSPGRTNVCIFRQTFTWSYPAFVRESEASTSLLRGDAQAIRHRRPSPRPRSPVAHGARIGASRPEYHALVLARWQAGRDRPAPGSTAAVPVVRSGTSLAGTAPHPPRPRATAIMLIRIGYEIVFDVPLPAPVHHAPARPSRRDDPVLVAAGRADDRAGLARRRNTSTSSATASGRILAPAGTLRLCDDPVVEDDGAPDPVAPDASSSPSPTSRPT